MRLFIINNVCHYVLFRDECWLKKTPTVAAKHLSGVNINTTVLNKLSSSKNHLAFQLAI